MSDDFQSRLESAIARGKRRAQATADEAKRKQLSEEEIKFEESIPETINPCVGFPKLFHFFKRRRSDAIGLKTQSIEQKLEHVMDRMDQLADLDPQIEAKSDSELTDVQEALRTIDRYLKMSKLNQYKSSRNVFSKK